MEGAEGELFRTRPHGPPVALCAALRGDAEELGSVRACLSPMAKDQPSHAPEAEDAALSVTKIARAGAVELPVEPSGFVGVLPWSETGRRSVSWY